MSSFRGKRKREDTEEVPTCDCPEGVRFIQKHVSNSERNPGREFWTCSICTGFLWCDEFEKNKGKLWVKRLQGGFNKTTQVQNNPEILCEIKLILERIEKKMELHEKKMEYIEEIVIDSMK